MTHLDSLEHNVQNHRTEATHTSTNLEVLEKCVVMMEDFLIHAGLWELRSELQGMQEEIAAIPGKWEEATIKLQGIGKAREISQAQFF